ncbi:MAG: hypothetical protein EAZ65_03500 [Verrucomicrobia bacterium]|nr:MAG: hypothetical protein EAZ65_03500 [Verrucomicrobiota bacterium]
MVRGRGPGAGGQWSVVSGQWSVVSGQWSVVSGQWSVVSGQCGQWSVVGGRSGAVRTWVTLLGQNMGNTLAGEGYTYGSGWTVLVGAL